jgi:glycosyltransferase involved in cell wall biosynthesis
MRVLFVNQTAQLGGAERSLLTLLDGLDGQVAAEAAIPTGALSQELADRSVRTHRIPSTNASFRLHPLHTPRAAAEMAAAAALVARLTRRNRYDVVHANTTRAGLIAAAAARLGAPPPVVHLRDWVPLGRLPAATLGVLRARSARLIANSRFIADQLPDTKSGAPVRVIHNAVDLAALDPDRFDRDETRAELGLTRSDVALGVVAQLTPWKGQEDAVRMLGLLRRRCPEARLLVAGAPIWDSRATRFDNRAYAWRLWRLPTELGIERKVRFIGQRRDVPRLLQALDLLLVPSWQEAFGRVVLEGMAMGLPVLATSVGGPREVLRDGVDGLLLPPRRPDLWASAVEELLADRARMRMMGASGRERAQGPFAPGAHAARVLEVYREAVGSRP